MFKVSTYPRIKTRIPLFIEVDGQKLDNTFGVTFQVLPVSDSTEEKLGTEEARGEFLRRAVVGLDDAVDDDNKPLPFTPELLAQLLDRWDVRVALLGQYFEVAARAAKGN